MSKLGIDLLVSKIKYIKLVGYLLFDITKIKEITIRTILNWIF